jgi:putative endopeptidase
MTRPFSLISASTFPAGNSSLRLSALVIAFLLLTSSANASNSVTNNVNIRGKLVAGEAIADLAGLKLAWRAFTETTEPAIDNPHYGLPKGKLFFLGFAHVLAGSSRQDLITRVQTDPHPPARYRVNGTLKNFIPFMNNYYLKKGDILHKTSPCRIW